MRAGSRRGHRASSRPTHRFVALASVMLLFFLLQATLGSWPPMLSSTSRLPNVAMGMSELTGGWDAGSPTPHNSSVHTIVHPSAAETQWLPLPFLSPWSSRDRLPLFTAWKEIYRSVHTHRRCTNPSAQAVCDASGAAAAPSRLSALVYDSHEGYFTVSLAKFFPEMFIFSVVWDGNQLDGDDAKLRSNDGDKAKRQQLLRYPVVPNTLAVSDALLVIEQKLLEEDAGGVAATASPARRSAEAPEASLRSVTRRGPTGAAGLARSTRHPHPNTVNNPRATHLRSDAAHGDGKRENNLLLCVAPVAAVSDYAVIQAENLTEVATRGAVSALRKSDFQVLFANFFYNLRHSITSREQFLLVLGQVLQDSVGATFLSLPVVPRRYYRDVDGTLFVENVSHASALRPHVMARPANAAKTDWPPLSRKNARVPLPRFPWYEQVLQWYDYRVSSALAASLQESVAPRNGEPRRLVAVDNSNVAWVIHDAAALRNLTVSVKRLAEVRWHDGSSDVFQVEVTRSPPAFGSSHVHGALGSVPSGSSLPHPANAGWLNDIERSRCGMRKQLLSCGARDRFLACPRGSRVT